MNNEEIRKIKLFTDLFAWQIGHKLLLEIYQATRHYPREELFGLVSQMRRCAVSITSNIAEGFSRKSYKEKIQFYSISLGSVTEIQNQIMISRDLGYLDEKISAKLLNQTVDLHKVINGLIKKSRIIHNS